MPRSRARKRANERAYSRRRFLRGICARCLKRRRPHLTTCADCGRKESLRRNAYQRLVVGARPRYADGRGYGPRVMLAPTPPLSQAATECPRCHGCLVAEGHDQKCLNCGHVLFMVARSRNYV